MKLLSLLSLAALTMLASCNLDPPYTIYNNVLIPIDERTVPEIAYVDIPMSIYAHASVDNGCWSNIRFIFNDNGEHRFDLFALADFESTGECPTVIVTADTTISFKPETVGDHIVTVWFDQFNYEVDTIRITEFTPEK